MPTVDRDRDTPTSNVEPPEPEPEVGDGKDKIADHPSFRSLVALVTAITGLVTAIAAFRRDQPEETAKESYVVLQKAFMGQQTEVEDLKKDVLSMRSSFEAYVRAKEGDGNVKPSANAPPDTIPPVEVLVRPTPTTPPAPGHPSALAPAHPIPAATQAPRLVVIPSARPAVTKPTPLPDVKTLEAKAHAKD